MSSEQRSLTSLRFLLFFFFSGTGCLVPFLSLHARAVGLSLEECHLIFILTPLIAAVGPILSGPLIDLCSTRRRSTTGVQNTCVRTYLSFTLLLAAILYSVLLVVPTVEKLPHRQPDVKFLCDHGGAVLVQEKCNDLECFRFPAEKTGILHIHQCKVDCDFELELNSFTTVAEAPELTTLSSSSSEEPPTTVTQPDTSRSINYDLNPDTFFGDDEDEGEDDNEEELGSGEEYDEYFWKKHRQRRADTTTLKPLAKDLPPHICYEPVGASRPKMCLVYSPDTDSLSINISIKSVHDSKQGCAYKLGGYFSCRIPQSSHASSSEACKLLCQIEDPYIPTSVLVQSQCQKIKGDPFLTFWVYFGVRSLADLFMATSAGLLIASTLVAVQNTIGRELVLPCLAYGAYAVLIGYLHADNYAPLSLEGIPHYFLAIVGCATFYVLAIFVLIFATNLPISPPDWWWSTKPSCKHKGETFLVYLVLFTLGVFWGPLVFHVPWHVERMPGIELYLAGAYAVGSIIAAPVLWKSDIIIDYCGYSNILITSFVFYIVRYTGLLLLYTPWVLVINGILDVFTFYLMLVTSVLYLRQLVPRRFTYTANSLLIAFNFCAGTSLGNFLWSFFTPPIEESEVLRHENGTENFEKLPERYSHIYSGGALAAAVVATLYFIIYHCCLKKRCIAPTFRKDNPDPVVLGPTENGSYTPLRVYSNGRHPAVDQVD